MDDALKTPVVLMIFNRPDVTRAAFDRIRSSRPRTLMVIADGPRADRPDEPDLCRQARAIVEQVDWPCELLRNYAETNLGCGRRVASGIDWVFQQVEQAIILEDDCLPDPSFFRFCEEILDHYRDEPRVMQISGSNFLFGRRPSRESYYFSRYPLCWGWATWRRAWRQYDFDMQAWKTDRERCLSRFKGPNERAFWRSAWDNVADGRVDTWDYQWSLACLEAEGLSVTPAVNLVSNVGFGPDATHTRSRAIAVRPAVGAISFPLRHPASLESDRKADEFTARLMFQKRSTFGKAAQIVRRRVLAIASRLRIGAGAPYSAGSEPSGVSD
jgi:hypothetical protein